VIDARGAAEIDHDVRSISSQQPPKDGFGEPIAVPESVTGDDDTHLRILARMWTEKQYHSIKAEAVVTARVDRMREEAIRYPCVRCRSRNSGTVLEASRLLALLAFAWLRWLAFATAIEAVVGTGTSRERFAALFAGSEGTVG
jgi:hypothetical protein